MTVQRSGASTSLLSSVLDSAALVYARAAEELAPFELTVDRWRVLDLVSRESALTMTALASRLSIPSTTATRLVDHLVSVGALYRVVDHGDRRRVVLHVSERGQDTLAAAAPTLQRLEDDLKAIAVDSGSPAAPDATALRTLLQLSRPPQ